MSEQKRHIVVDGIDFKQLFRFPAILRAVTHAMQPPRLLVALLTLMVLIVGGERWDAAFENPDISPWELKPAGLASIDDEDEAQKTLREIATNFDKSRKRDNNFPEEEGQPWPNLDPVLIRELYEADYEFRRNRDVERGLAYETIADKDREFLATLDAIDAVSPRRAFHATTDEITAGFKHVLRGVVYVRPREVGRGFADLFIHLPVSLWALRPWFTIVYGLFAAVVLALGGGALSRMSACEFSGRERLRSRDAIDFSLKSAGRLITAPLLPLILSGILAVVLMTIGAATMFIPWVDVIGGLIYGLSLLLGFLIAFILLGFAGSFLMVIPAVASENCGPVDAHQRAFAYLISRPLHLLGYVLVALVGLVIGYLVVSLVAVTTLNVTAATVGALQTNSAMTIAGGASLTELHVRLPGDFHRQDHSALTADFIWVWQTLVVSLVFAYVISYFFSCSTIIYMLMRRAVDGQDYSEIWRPGLVPGTLAPIPKFTHTPAASPAESAAGGGGIGGLAEAFFSRGLRALTSLRFRFRRTPKTAQPVAAAPAAEAPVEDESTAPEKPDADLGPELMAPDDDSAADADESPKATTSKKSATRKKKSTKKKTDTKSDQE